MAQQLNLLAERIAQAYKIKTPLQIEGGGSKSFLGNKMNNGLSESIGCHDYAGVIDYRKDELMIRLKAGTLLADVEKLLLDNGQRLPFEPPEFQGNATIGGVVAAGLSGPARPYFGSVRDYVLGVSFIDGRGTAYEMGGQVMKNVAGYDVSRLMVGSLGELGLICDVSFKVLPGDEVSATFVWPASAVEAVNDFQRYRRNGLPLTGSAWVSGIAYLRIGGSAQTVKVAAVRLSGDRIPSEEGEQFWRDLKNQKLDVFKGRGPLWRVSTEPGSAALLDNTQVVEWGGGIRWISNPTFAPRLKTDPQTVTLFRRKSEDSPNETHDEASEVIRQPFQQLSSSVAELNRKLKKQFDPGLILNAGRLFEA
jgi:glycolate oxidase FAD binding subunit